MAISKKTKHELALIVLILGCLFLLYTTILGEGGYRQLQAHRRQLRQFQLENARLRQMHRSYLQRIHKLKNDLSEIERISRERYNFAQPGDIIVNLPGSPSE